MKKLLCIALCGLFLMTGCSNSHKKETKTCTLKIDEENNVNLIAVLKAEDNIIKQMEISLSTPNVQISDMSIEGQEQLLENTWYENINVKDKSGIKVDATINDKKTITITIDVDKLSDEGKEKILDDKNGKLLLSEKVKLLEKNNMECK